MKEYIERAAAIEAIRKYQYPYGVEFLLSNIPAADVVEVRHGRWVDNTFCSCCGGFDEDDEGNIIQSFHNYCPSCGALMDKEDENGAD